jgi:hypothetical protein
VSAVWPMGKQDSASSGGTNVGGGCRSAVSHPLRRDDLPPAPAAIAWEEQPEARHVARRQAECRHRSAWRRASRELETLRRGNGARQHCDAFSAEPYIDLDCETAARAVQTEG